MRVFVSRSRLKREGKRKVRVKKRDREGQVKRRKRLEERGGSEEWKILIGEVD